MNNTQSISPALSGELKQDERVIVLVINVILAWVIYLIGTGELIPSGNGASIWFLSATSYWFLSLLGTPFFTPPKDSFSTSIAVILLLLPLDFTTVANYQTTLTIIKFTTVTLALTVAVAAIVAIVHRGTVIGDIAFNISKHLGRGEILFTLVIVIATLAFYQNELQWMYCTMVFWTIMLTMRPVALGYKAYVYIKEYFGGNTVSKNIRVGTIVRIDDPNVARVRISDKDAWGAESIYLTRLPDGSGHYVLPLFKQLQNEDVIGTGILCEATGVLVTGLADGGVYQLSNQQEGLVHAITTKLSGDDLKKRVVGIVVEGSTIDTVRFQTTRDATLEKGMVVFSLIRDTKVYYQILDASTDEEGFLQNPYGMHIATAFQLGTYDKKEGFQKFPWLPSMNQPLFLVSIEQVCEQELSENEFNIGKVPYTNFSVPVKLNDMVEYHTAILGTTGTGKTALALDLIRKALDHGTKVFCVDITGEYKPLLDTYKPTDIGLTEERVTQLEDALFAVETGTYGAKEERAALKKFLDEIKPEVVKEVEAFLEDDAKRLGIFALDEITNTKASLKTTELYLSSIMSWARKHRKEQQILIVLEEAHTIIPESYFAGFDNDTQWVVGKIGQIALQGRKYGVGLLIVSQRTALVSKTILSQCNTYFTHALMDKTSLDYLAGVYSSEHVKTIPNLQTREFLAQGVGVKSQRPILVKVDYDPEKKKATDALNSKKKVAGATLPTVVTEVPVETPTR